MEFKEETLKKIFARKEINENYQLKYYWLSKVLEKEGLTAYSEKMNRRGENLLNCMDVWWWNAYRTNKVLDLQKVNRCKNTRFCPNCRTFELSKFFHHFGKIYSKHIRDRYNPFLLTLTIPNVKGEELSETITKLYDSFNRFFKALNQEIGQGKKGYKDRLMTFDGGLRVLEITYNSENNTFHPHLHCLMLSEEYDKELFDKKYCGEYSYKRESYNMYSELDLHLQKIWYMCYNKIRLTKKNYDNLTEKYLVDIKEIDEGGIYEVIKYTFKDTDVQSNYVFKTLVMALENRRIRQGFGVLKGLKCEDIEDGEMQNIEDYLLIDKDENPIELHFIKDYVKNKKAQKKEVLPEDIEKDLNTLLTPVYKNYKKISRFKSDKFLNNID